MPEYVIVSDVDNIIKYHEVYEGEVNRQEVVNHRARLEALRAQKADIEVQIAELEKLIEKDEFIVKLANDKKAEEVTLDNTEENLAQETPSEENAG